MGSRKADGKKTLARLLRLVDRTDGWSWEHGGHGYKIRTPDNVPIFTACTPSDHRAILNIRAQLRRHGLNC
jgi:hypothetical protein